MEMLLLVIACGILGVAVIVLALGRTKLISAAARLETLGSGLDRVEGSLRDELRSTRRETAESVQRLSDSLVQAQGALGQAQTRQLDTFAKQLAASAQASGEQIAQLRTDLNASLQMSDATTTNSIAEVAKLSLARVDAFASDLTQRMSALESRSADELTAIRRDSQASSEMLRDRVASGLSEAADIQNRKFAEVATFQEQQWNGFRVQVEALRSTVESKFENLRNTVDHRLREIQDDSASKLDQMRQTVDEKLHSTLEARLGESFRQVSDRLEQVYKGLGEMQVLATGVGDLKRVLSNVRARGTWGEVQLATLLEQVLAPDQYAENMATSDTGGEHVEFAVRLPGRSGSGDAPVWLPIDSKFPLEDYQALLDAAERTDAAALDEAARRLEARVKACAKDVSVKYLNPPRTTDFAIMFLPNEGLYAEVLRRTGLADLVQQQYRVVIAGPTTLWAILTSLQMGFRTVAIERRSSEVWALLGAVKTEFAKFGTVLDGIQKNLHHAATKIDEARKGTRSIQRKLTEVQELPAPEAAVVLEGALLEVHAGAEGALS
jgi:DNA recombination protein RmuC